MCECRPEEVSENLRRNLEEACQDLGCRCVSAGLKRSDKVLDTILKRPDKILDAGLKGFGQ